jgi:hypothetical protein
MKMGEKDQGKVVDVPTFGDAKNVPGALASLLGGLNFRSAKFVKEKGEKKGKWIPTVVKATVDHVMGWAYRVDPITEKPFWSVVLADGSKCTLSAKA